MIPPLETEQFVSSVFNSLVFFEEFSFSKTKFKATKQEELELADAVVLLDDVLLVMQIKERSIHANGAEDAERRWFESKVIKIASRQIRDTLSFLKDHDSIEVANERGRIFNLGAQRYREIIKLILYRPAANLPQDCRSTKFHISQSAGFIHLIDATDYLEIARVLRVPEDVIRYLRYRETMLTKFGGDCALLPEAALVGGYIGDGDHKAPNRTSFEHLFRLVPDDETWDISNYLRTLRDHTSDPAYDDDYYAILTEFVRLPRSMWREFKKRLMLCIENAAADKFALPYRIAFPDRDVGFMLFAPDSGFTKRPGWTEHKTQGLITFTYLHKFDQKLRKCIGVQVGKVGEYFDIQWCMINEEWVDNPELRKELDENSPFRPIRTQEQFSYFLRDR